MIREYEKDEKRNCQIDNVSEDKKMKQPLI